MANKNYQKGYNFERKVKRFLEKGGWVVFRQGKSSFPDLICIKPNLIQSSTDAKCQQLIDFAVKDTCLVMAVECKKRKGKYYQTKEDKESIESFKQKCSFIPLYLVKDIPRKDPIMERL